MTQNDKEMMGMLYNYYTIDDDNFVPTGWRIPSLNDVSVLTNYLIENGYNWDGSLSSNKVGKAVASKYNYLVSTVTGQIGNNSFANNSSGMSLIPNGYRNENATFFGRGSVSYTALSNNKGVYTGANRSLMYTGYNYEAVLTLSNADYRRGVPVLFVRNIITDSKSVTIVAPSATGDAAYLSIFETTDKSVGLANVKVMVYGGTNVQFSIHSGATFRTSQTTHVSSQTVNSGGTYSSVTVANAIIPAGRCVWVQINSVSGVVQQVNVTLNY